jgi:ABC-2 type transport system permease protein
MAEFCGVTGVLAGGQHITVTVFFQTGALGMPYWFTHIKLLVRKELKSFFSDRVLLLFVIYAFSLHIVIEAKGSSLELHNAAIAIVDEDRSALSRQLFEVFRPPQFATPRAVEAQQVNTLLDRGEVTFVIDVPPKFTADLLAGKQPAIQVLIDATAMSHAFLGSFYIQQIIQQEINRYLTGRKLESSLNAIDGRIRIKFNPNRIEFWFMGVSELLIMITLLSMILPGAALLREKEHGTIEHLLIMPLRPVEIMLAKFASNAMIVLLGTALSLYITIEWILGIPLRGSIALFLLGTLVYQFTTCSLGMLLATFTRNIPQHAGATIIIIFPMVFLSGIFTPPESMGTFMQYLVKLAPLQYFNEFAAGIFFRGAGLALVWQELAAMMLMGAVFFTVTVWRFRRHLSL